MGSVKAKQSQRKPRGEKRDLKGEAKQSKAENINPPKLEKLSDDSEPATSDLEREDSGNESDGSSESESSVPQLKKQKTKKNDSASFSNAVNSILNSHLKAYDRKDPILARQKKKVIRKFEDEKLELKARKLLSLEKRARDEKARVADLLPSNDDDVRAQLDYEKKLKKTAQRGVIQLFNAVLKTQVNTDKEMKKEAKLSDSKKSELSNDISKEMFLDMVKAAK